MTCPTAVIAECAAAAVRPGFGFDVDRLAAWMRRHVDGFEGPLRVEQFKGGQSNPTYRLGTPGRHYVLRRKPPGPLLRGAHAIEREARVTAALSAAGFPVPRPLGLCADEDVIGTPFYVMELVEGRIFWDATFPQVHRSERPAYFDAMNRTLAQLHAIDPGALGLDDYGRGEGYVERQLARWSSQYESDADAGRDGAMDNVLAWLRAHLPPGGETALVHGDFRCDNMIFDPCEPRVLAVLDWELSTIGHPLVDFAYHAMMYRVPGDIVAGLAGADLSALNIPAEQDYCAAYCARTGRDRIEHYDFYIVFNLFRLAAIFHGIKGRFIRGNAVSADARSKAESFPQVARLAWAAVEGIR